MATQLLRVTTARRAKPDGRRMASASKTIAKALHDVAKQQQEVCAGEVSSKSLHDLRVACRRAEAALRLASGFGRNGECKKLIKRSQEIRDACNSARDDDVLRHWLREADGDAGKEMIRSLKKRRDDALAPVVKAIGHPRGAKQFAKQIRDLMEDIRRAERKEPMQPVLGKHLFDELGRFVSRCDIQPDDQSSLHHLRIAGKRFRYSCEFAMEILGDSKWTPLINYLQKIQDQVGQIHDQTVGIESLRREKEAMDAKQFKSLEKKATATMQRLEKAFWKWWQSHDVASLISDVSGKIVALVRYRP